MGKLARALVAAWKAIPDEIVRALDNWVYRVNTHLHADGIAHSHLRHSGKHRRRPAGDHEAEGRPG